MVILWILGYVSDSTRKSIIYVDTAQQIWVQLEKQFSLISGSRKDKLNKELYETNQHNRSISEYYRQMKAIWEELVSLNTLSTIYEINAEVKAFLKALEKQKEKHKLFQFLNGREEGHGAQGSHILIMRTLPNVEITCNL